MKRKLDRKRPFSEIYGEHAGKYEQFGILFDAEGTELEGYQDVVVPADVPEITTETKEPALRAEISRLTAELGRVTAELEEKDAEIEEVQGKLDTATVEIERLNAATSESLFPDQPGKGKKGSNAVDIDEQMKAQGIK